MMTWTVQFTGREGNTGFAVVTADSVEVGVLWLRKALADIGLPQEVRYEQFIPMVTSTRKVRILTEG